MLQFRDLDPREGFAGALPLFMDVPPQQADIKIDGSDGLVLVAQDDSHDIRIEIHWADGYRSAYIYRPLIAWALKPEMSSEDLRRLGFTIPTPR